MDYKVEMEKIMDACGGEDLLRYLIKEDGVINWDSITINPIVAYSPRHMDRAIMVGCAYRHGNSFHILHSAYDFTEHPKFERWVNYLMEMDETYEMPAEALLDHNRAIIATEMDIDDAQMTSWEDIVKEVIDGERPNRYDSTSSSPLFDSEHDMADVLFDALFGLKNFIELITQETDVTLEVETSDIEDFNMDWQEEWS